MNKDSFDEHPTPLRDDRVVFLVPAEKSEQRALSIRDLWNIFWQSKVLICAMTAAFVVCALAYALLADQWFKAEVVLVPARKSQGVAGQLGGLAGLASIAGINIGEKNESTEALAVLQSREFAREFIHERNLLPVLFADEWDSKNGKWISANPKDWPDERDAVRYFERTILHVTEDKRTSLISLTVEWKNRETAAEWANVLVLRLNERMRQRAIAEADRHIKFLRAELVATDVITLQQSISRLLETELQSLMLARGNDEFAFRVVDRANIPKWRSRPKRTLTVVLAAIGGALVSAVTAFLVHALRGDKRGGYAA